MCFDQCEERAHTWRDIPKPEKRMLAMPRFLVDTPATLSDKIGYYKSLCGGEENHRERTCVFQSVPKWAATVIQWTRVLDHALSKAHEVWKAKSRQAGIQAAGVTKNTYLINVGKIHLYQPSCTGGVRRLPPGSNMQTESQTSPSTFAYEVKMSAKITSEKCMRWFSGEYMHLLILL
jgi:hypothetical protein